jgi:hypothetical protein
MRRLCQLERFGEGLGNAQSVTRRFPASPSNSASISAGSVELGARSFFIGDSADSIQRAARRRERVSLFCLIQARAPQAHNPPSIELAL